MADHVIESRLWLPRPRSEVFALVADAAGLPRLFPPALRVTFARPPEPMAAGAVYDLRLRWHGVPLRWRCFVREYDPPYRFVDVQVRGPWARWEQRHRLLEADGGTWLDERLTYRPPLGPVGRLLHVVWLRRELDALAAYRRRRLAALLAPVSAEAG
jgi:ligand-binding SRPBCC domain-containing protein